MPDKSNLRQLQAAEADFGESLAAADVEDAIARTRAEAAPTRNCVNSSFHHRSRRCLSVG